MLRTDIVGFDNKFYTIYIKKNDKSYSHRNKGGMAIKKANKIELPKMNTMSEGLTMSNFNSNFNSNQKTNNIFYQLFTST